MKSIKLWLFLLLASATSLMAKETGCRYNGGESVLITYANASTNIDLEDVFFINLGFDCGSYTQFIMDTGSCGIVASPDYFQPAADAENLGLGEALYTDGSTTKTLTGTFWSATQQIYNENGKLIATSHVPVLQVTSQVINGVTTIPTDINVMGIGFGREGNEVPPKTPFYNPFLNLTAIMKKGHLRPLPKNWVNGYVITANFVELGLTSKNTRGAGFIKLENWPQYSTAKLPEWMPMSMTVCVNNVCGNGMSVMDTGIKNGIINPPPTAVLGPLVNCPGTTLTSCVASGNTFSIYYPNSVQPVAFYTFTTGQTGNNMQPDSVAVQSRPTIYWNTGRHFIGGINFVYDNKHGLAGFIWNNNTSSEFGYVIPQGH